MNPFIHKHWMVIACDKMTDVGSYEFPVEISVQDAENEEQAILKAKEVVVRKIYHLRSVRECSTCADLDRHANAVSEVARNIKDHND